MMNRLNHNRGPARHGTLILSCLIVLSLSFYINPALAGDTLTDAIMRGITHMNAGEFDKAIETLDGLISDDFILNDFLLFWRAESHLGMDNYEKAMSDIERIKKHYRGSSVLRDTLRIEIETRRKRYAGNDDHITSLYESYIAAYPGDTAARYEYATFLTGKGFRDYASRIFRELYIEASDFADEAAAEFDISTLGIEDLLKRGNNLLKKWRFAGAEETFHRAIQIAPENLKLEIREKIAYAKFRQKKYAATAGLYGSLNERYMEAVSYLRTGRTDALVRTIGTLKAMKDPRTGRLLIALASGMRKRGLIKDAAVLLQEALDNFPFKEDALWEIGWTHYMGKNYTAAEETFKTLYETYRSGKYLYWMLRSREKRSSPPLEAYKKLCSESDYYGFLGCIRAGLRIKKVEAKTSGPPADSPELKRYTILKSLGLKDKALAELRKSIKHLRESRQVIRYSRKLRDIGEYKKAISTATMVPYNEDIHGLLYPFAYWDIIREASRKFSVDPLYILSIAREESRLDPEARSIAGAIGLMQLMPSTARRMSGKIRYPIPDKKAFYDIETNITLGAYYLKILLEKFESIPLATAAYNAGENTVRKWLAGYEHGGTDEFIEDIPYPETGKYVKKVLTTFFQYARAYHEEDKEEYLIKDISLLF